MFSIIVAMDRNALIGKNGNLPWHLPEDLKYVRNVTMGHTIVMGRKNFESIGRPLPGRTNVVLTRNRSFSAGGYHVVHSVQDVFDLCRKDEEVFIFGGADIYKLFFPYVKRMYVTRVFHEFNVSPADNPVYFPPYDESEWKEISADYRQKDANNPYDFAFHVYERQQD